LTTWVTPRARSASRFRAAPMEPAAPRGSSVQAAARSAARACSGAGSRRGVARACPGQRRADAARRARCSSLRANHRTRGALPSSAPQAGTGGDHSFLARRPTLRKCPPACCTSTGLHDRRYQARAAATQQQLCSRCAAAGTRRCALQYSQAAGKDSVNSTPRLVRPGTVCGCRWCYSGRLAENLHCAAPSQRPVRCPGCGRGARTDKQALQHLAGLGVALRKAPHGHKPVDGDQPRVFVLLLSGHPACAATGEQRPCDAPGSSSASTHLCRRPPNMPTLSLAGIPPGKLPAGSARGGPLPTLPCKSL